MSNIKYIFILLFFLFSLAGCSDNNELSSEERMWQEYSDNDRLEKYNLLTEEYGQNYWILNNNKKEDSLWGSNTVIWLISIIAPDAAATITLAGSIWLIIFFTGAVLTGGAILKILATVGDKVPLLFLPASIAGILVIGIILVIIHRLLSGVFSLIF